MRTLWVRYCAGVGTQLALPIAFAHLRQNGLLVHFERANKRLLWDFDTPELAHLLLTGLLLFQQLLFPARVAAVAFGGDVLAHGRKRLAGDDLAADGRLDRDLEHVTWNEALELFAHRAAAHLGA